MRHKAIKLPGNNIGESLDELGFGDDFWDTTQKNTIHGRKILMI